MKKYKWWQSPFALAVYVLLMVGAVYAPQLFALIGYAELAPDLKIKTSQDRIGKVTVGTEVQLTKITGTGTSTGTATASSANSTDTMTLSVTGAITSRVGHIVATLTKVTGTGTDTGTATATAMDSTDTATLSQFGTATLTNYIPWTATGTGTDQVVTGNDPRLTATGTVTGTGSENYVAKWSRAAALKASGIYEDTAGNVGVGTDSPATKLSILGDFLLKNAAHPGYIGWTFKQLESGHLVLSYTSDWLTVDYSNGNASFVGSVVASYLGAGLGASTPHTALDVNGVASSGWLGGDGEFRSYQAAGVEGYVSLKTDAATAHRSGLYRFNAGFFSYYDTSTGDVGMDAQFSGANLVFQIGSSEKMRVDNSGNVGIGTTNPTASVAIEAEAAKVTLLSTTGTNAVSASMQNTSGVFACGLEGSAGGALIAGTTPYAAVCGTTGDYPMQFAVKNAVRATISGNNMSLVGTHSAGGNSIVCSGVNCSGVSGTGTATATASGTGTFRLLNGTPVTILGPTATTTATGSLYSASPAYLTTGTSTATATAADLFSSPKVHVSVGTTSGTVAAGDDSRFGAVAYHSGDNPDYLSSRVSAGAGISLAAAGSHPNQTLQISSTYSQMITVSTTVLNGDYTSDYGYYWLDILQVGVSTSAKSIVAMGNASITGTDGGYCTIKLVFDSTDIGGFANVYGHAAASRTNLAVMASNTFSAGSTHTVHLTAQANEGARCLVPSNSATLVVQEFN